MCVWVPSEQEGVQELWKEAVEERERSAAASCGSEPRRRRVASVGVGAKSAWEAIGS